MDGIPSTSKIMNTGVKAAKVGVGLVAARQFLEPMVPNLLPMNGADILADLVLGAVVGNYFDEEVGAGIALSGVLNLAGAVGLKV